MSIFSSLSSLLTITPGKRQALLGEFNGERRLEETAPLRNCGGHNLYPLTSYVVGKTRLQATNLTLANTQEARVLKRVETGGAGGGW